MLTIRHFFLFIKTNKKKKKREGLKKKNGYNIK